MATRSSSISSVGGSSRNMGVSDIPKSGRELAIEALIDLDDRGPAFRVGRILVSERMEELCHSRLLSFSVVQNVILIRFIFVSLDGFIYFIL